MEGIGRRNLVRAYGYDDGVPSVVTTRTTSADVGVCSKDVDKFTLAFVTPLRTQNDGHYKMTMVSVCSDVREAEERKDGRCMLTAHD